MSAPTIESDADKVRLRQLASIVSVVASDASVSDCNQRVYEATCEVLAIMRRESLERAAAMCEGMTITEQGLERHSADGAWCAMLIRSFIDTAAPK